VLALANAFQEAKRAGQGPRRSILFLLTAGEEQGLLGSSYYATHPAFPLSQTVANLNLAMLGRTDKRHTNKDHYVYLIGTDWLSTELHQLSEATNARTTRLKLDYFYNSAASTDHLYYRSDHYNFARYGIPVIAYTSGFTPDYQRATDDLENIDFDKLTERTRLIFYTAWEIANRDQRLVVDSNKK
jgi:Zn-dependent M28 family amino/carboxypeptidase